MNKDIMRLIQIFSVNGECDRQGCLENIQNAFSSYSMMDSKEVGDYNKAIKVLSDMTDEEYQQIDFTKSPIKVVDAKDLSDKNEKKDKITYGIQHYTLDFRDRSEQIIDIPAKLLNLLSEYSERKNRE